MTRSDLVLLFALATTSGCGAGRVVTDEGGLDESGELDGTQGLDDTGDSGQTGEDTRGGATSVDPTIGSTEGEDESTTEGEDESTTGGGECVPPEPYESHVDCGDPCFAWCGDDQLPVCSESSEGDRFSFCQETCFGENEVCSVPFPVAWGEGPTCVSGRCWLLCDESGGCPEGHECVTTFAGENEVRHCMPPALCGGPGQGCCSGAACDAGLVCGDDWKCA